MLPNIEICIEYCRIVYSAMHLIRSLFYLKSVEIAYGGPLAVIIDFCRNDVCTGGYNYLLAKVILVSTLFLCCWCYVASSNKRTLRICHVGVNLFCFLFRLRIYFGKQFLSPKSKNNPVTFGFWAQIFYGGLNQNSAS